MGKSKGGKESLPPPCFTLQSICSCTYKAFVTYSILRLRTTAARPAKPAPKSSMVVGSGTGVVTVDANPSIKGTDGVSY